MAKRVDSLVWRLAIEHPSGPRKQITRHVLRTLSRWGNKSGDSMFPCMEKIAVAAAVHRETVRLALDEAEEEQFVIRIRQKLRSGGFHYRYFAAVPDDWSLMTTTELREWERDPDYSAERLRRPRHKRGRVPVQNGDASTFEQSSSPSPEQLDSVPIQDCERPSPSFAASPFKLGSVPIQAGHTSSGISSRTQPYIKPSTGAAETEQGTIDIENIPVKIPHDARKSANETRNGDFEKILDRVEKVVVALEIDGTANTVLDSGLIAKLTRCSDLQVRTAIKQLYDRKRLPIPRRT